MRNKFKVPNRAIGTYWGIKNSRLGRITPPAVHIMTDSKPDGQHSME